MTLPFLVVHGAIVWKLLVPLLAIATIAACRFVHGVLRRIEVRNDATFRARDCGRLEPGRVVLRGRLRGGALVTATCGDLRRPARIEAPWFEGDDGTRVELRDPVHVSAGTRVTTAMLGRPRGTPAALVLRGGGWMLRTIGDGDPVLVEGELRPREAPPNDRDAARWELAEVDMMAASPTERAPAPRIVPRLVGFTVVAAAWFGILAAIGSQLADTARKHLTLDELGPFAIAAALPGSRARVLEIASARNVGLTGHTGSGQLLGDQLDALVGGCSAARHQQRQGRFDEAVASARACGARDLEFDVLLSAGRYEEAHAIEPVDELVAIGVSDWKAAAAATRDDCHRAWYRSMSGMPDAFDRLDPDDRDSWSCSELRAIMLRAPEESRIVSWFPWLASEVPATERTEPLLAHQAHVRGTRWLPQLPDTPVDTYDDCPFEERAEAIREAGAGDGRALARVMASCQPSLSDAWLASILPSLAQGRAEVADALRARRHAIIVHRGFDFVEELVLDRDLARLAGDLAQVATQQRYIDRHLAHLTADRIRVIAASNMWR